MIEFLKTCSKGQTYIRVVANLLDHIRVEVTGIALEAFANGERVLESTKDLPDDVVDAALAELEILVVIAALVNGLDPAVVARCSRVIDMVLELNDVGVGNMVGVNSAQDGSRVAVNGLGAQRSGLGDSRQRESGKGTHSGGIKRLPETNNGRERKRKDSGEDAS